VLVIRILVALSLCLSAAPACGLLSSKRSESNNAPASSEISVEVENHNWSDIRIYLVTGDLPHRLGMVPALSSATFAFPSHRLNTGSGVRLRALPMAGRAFTSETIPVQPGQAIFWMLENDLDTSSLSVYQSD
jgi:hypothetical protein